MYKSDSKRILVTDSAGFLGSHSCDRLDANDGFACLSFLLQY